MSSTITMVETRVATPQPLPVFQEYFARHDKFFSQAALAWAEDRRVLFPFGNGAIDAQIIPAITAAVSGFDNKVLSDRFDDFTPHFARAANVILWSQGNQDIQEGKIAAVKARWLEKKAGIDPNAVPKLIDEAKMEKVSQILMQANSMARGRPKERQSGLPLVIIEDKITNMMKFMHTFIAKFDQSNNVPQFSEDSLDKEDFQFDKYLNDWIKAIGKYSKHFNDCQFIYVPPDKAEDYKTTADKSTLRDKKVREWIAASNKALKEAKARDSIIPSAIARTIFQYLPDQFFHIDDKPELEKIITSHTIVVADVDGPLVSQQKVLATREVALQSAYKRLLDAAYYEKFMIDFGSVGTYFLFPTNDPAIVFQRNSASSKMELGIGTKYMRMENIAAFWKDLSPGKVTITFRRIKHLQIDLVEEITFDFNPSLFRSAMNSLGYRTHFTEMVI